MDFIFKHKRWQTINEHDIQRQTDIFKLSSKDERFYCIQYRIIETRSPLKKKNRTADREYIKKLIIIEPHMHTFERHRICLPCC